MIFDPNPYRRTLEASKHFLLKPGRSITRACSELSAVSNVPLMAVVLFSMRHEVVGPKDELSEMYDSLIQFYGYTEIKEWEQP